MIKVVYDGIKKKKFIKLLKTNGPLSYVKLLFGKMEHSRRFHLTMKNWKITAQFLKSDTCVIYHLYHRKFSINNQ